MSEIIKRLKNRLTYYLLTKDGDILKTSLARTLFCYDSTEYLDPDEIGDYLRAELIYQQIRKAVKNE